MARMSGVAWSGAVRLTLALGLATAGVSCGDVVRQSRAPVFLVIDSLQGATGSAGGDQGQLGNPLLSDVAFMSDPCSATAPCIFNDVGQVVFRIVRKDSVLDDSGNLVPSAPSPNNSVTITRYRVTYRRTDGRNVEGVDVPYAFDGAVTGTVPPSGSLTLGFELVRHVAKQEPPLVHLWNNPTIITTIAEVTFYGQDLVGNDISATGLLQIDFGNLADAE